MDLLINKHRIRFSIDSKSLNPNKATIIFLHDSLGCIELWRDFPEEVSLNTGYNVLSYDRQGYGKSAPFTITKRSNDYLKKEAETLGEIIDALRLKNVILFGHSDGGTIALLAAALYPEKITGIITEGAHVFIEPETLKGIREAKKAYTTTNLKEKLSKYHADKTEDVFNIWVETWLSDKFQSWNIEKFLPKIICPSLIIQGEKDEYGTVDQVHSIIKNTTGKATPLLIPNIAHTPHREAPAYVIEQTVRFLKETLFPC